MIGERPSLRITVEEILRHLVQWFVRWFLPSCRKCRSGSNIGRQQSSSHAEIVNKQKQKIEEKPPNCLLLLKKRKSTKINAITAATTTTTRTTTFVEFEGNRRKCHFSIGYKMGNKQSNAITANNENSASTSETAVNRSRRESLHRVFGRFSQKKLPPPKDIMTSNTTDDPETSTKKSIILEKYHSTCSEEIQEDDDDVDEFYSHRSHYDSPESERDCGIVILREVSISSDSLFTESSDNKASSPLTSDIDDNDIDKTGNDENENTYSSRLHRKEQQQEQQRQQQHQPHRKLSTRKPNSSTRPVSDVSAASGDTSGFGLSPTTAQAVVELQQQNRIDKLSQLSVSRTEIFEIIPTAATNNDTSSPDLGAESADEQMALQLGKKLAQMLHSNNNNLGGVGDDDAITMNTNATATNSSSNNGNSAPSNFNLTTEEATTTTTATEFANNGNGGGGGSGNANNNSGVCNGTPAAISLMNTNEIFNIAKAKKIELQNLSSRLAASGSTTAAAPTATIAAIALLEQIASTENNKHSLQASTSASSGSGSTTPNAATTGEKQSTVIISFKSSQTPAQAQHQQQQQQQQKSCTEHATSTTSSSQALSTSISNIAAAASVAGTATPPHTGAANSNTNTTDIASSTIVGTPKCNVLKKVASFTLEKASPTMAAALAAATATASAAGDGNICGGTVAAHMEHIAGGSAGTGNGSNTITNRRRLSYVPEKLSFDAYEKFEGQMLLKWLVSSLQTGVNNSISNGSNNNGGSEATNNNKFSNLTEQDLNFIAMQYCNNLMHIGVLKQISEKACVGFSPFEMYQWAHNAIQYNAQPTQTPGKLDKTQGVWQYCSTPQSVMKTGKVAVLADGSQAPPLTPTPTLDVLRRRLLSCQTIADVQAIIDEMLPIGEIQRRPSKRCLHMAELLDASETTVYECNRTADGGKISKQNQTRNAATQHEAGNYGTCCTCAGKTKQIAVKTTTTVDMAVQTDASGDDTDDDDKSDSTTAAAPSIPPPPPMPPMLSKPAIASVPPPPPPPPPPPAPAFPSDASGLQVSSKSSTPTSVSPIPPPPPPPALQSNSKTNVSASQGTPTRSPSNTNVPSPLPALPSDSSFFIAKNVLRKTAVNPPKPMRPLYWTRIITPAAPPKLPVPPPLVETPTESTDSSAGSSPEELPVDAVMMPTAPSTPKEIWQEIEETKIDNLDEFTELFSRQAVAPPVKLVKPKPERVRTVKVLDAKRSQNVGIVARTLHVDFCEIEHAIYNLDSSVVSLETLQHIVHMKATDQELEQIKEAAKDDLPLDLPEQFLLKLSQISMSNERISCIVFQTEFEDAATIVTRKLEVISSVSKFLIESEDLKILFSIILTLGNYMNGGNVQRGQADGFTLEILNKLKDVKSQQSQITLLHFIVRTYINNRRKGGLQLLEIPFPIPEPSEIERAMQVDFIETQRQINELNNKLNACRKTTEAVLLASTPETVEPFKTKMESVMEEALKTVDKLTKELAACRAVFIDAMRFYQFKPKTGTVETCTPAQFFEYWTHFTNDFRDIWKREIAMICDALMKRTKQLEKEARKNIKTTKAKPGGLKERMLRLRNQEQKK